MVFHESNHVKIYNGIIIDDSDYANDSIRCNGYVDNSNGAKYNEFYQNYTSLLTNII